MSEYETISLDATSAGIAILTLNRPDKHNAFNSQVIAELTDALETLEEQDTLRMVILRGAGKCFSAGHDLGDIAEGEKVPSPGWHSETLRMMEKLPKPVIAAVHGHCCTGALEVALAADFILAAESAKFADTHAKWALTPIWGMSQRLPRRVGTARAKRLMFTAETVRADAALNMGLCEAVFAEDAFEDELRAFAKQILANSAFSHAANKKLLEATDSDPMDAGLQWEITENEGVGPDMHARINAFMKK